MTDEKDMGSDAARTDPDNADRDREVLKRGAEKHIERVMQNDGKDPVERPVEGSRRLDDSGDSQASRDEDKAAGGQSTSGSEAAEPSPE